MGQTEDSLVQVTRARLADFVNQRENTMNALLNATVKDSEARLRDLYDMKISQGFVADCQRENDLIADIRQVITRISRLDITEDCIWQHLNRENPEYDDRAEVPPWVLEDTKQDLQKAKDEAKIALRALDYYSLNESYGFNNNNELRFVGTNGYGLRNILAVFWEATKHSEHWYPGVTAFKAQMAIIEAMADSHRGHNRNNSEGVDDNRSEDLRVCDQGHYNKLGEKFSPIHIHVDVMFDAMGVMRNRFRTMIAQRLVNQYPINANQSDSLKIRTRDKIRAIADYLETGMTRFLSTKSDAGLSLEGFFSDRVESAADNLLIQIVNDFDSFLAECIQTEFDHKSNAIRQAIRLDVKKFIRRGHYEGNIKEFLDDIGIADVENHFEFSSEEDFDRWLTLSSQNQHPSLQRLLLLDMHQTPAPVEAIQNNTSRNINLFTRFRATVTNRNITPLVSTPETFQHQQYTRGLVAGDF